VLAASSKKKESSVIRSRVEPRTSRIWGIMGHLPFPTYMGKHT